MSSLEWLFTKGYNIFRGMFAMFLIFVSFIAFIVSGMAETEEVMRNAHVTGYICGAFGVGIIASICKPKK